MVAWIVARVGPVELSDNLQTMPVAFSKALHIAESYPSEESRYRGVVDAPAARADEWADALLMPTPVPTRITASGNAIKRRRVTNVVVVVMRVLLSGCMASTVGRRDVAEVMSV